MWLTLAIESSECIVGTFYFFDVIRTDTFAGFQKVPSKFASRINIIDRHHLKSSRCVTTFCNTLTRVYVVDDAWHTELSKLSIICGR